MPDHRSSKSPFLIHRSSMRSRWIILGPGRHVDWIFEDWTWDGSYWTILDSKSPSLMEKNPGGTGCGCPSTQVPRQAKKKRDQTPRRLKKDGAKHYAADDGDFHFDLDLAGTEAQLNVTDLDLLTEARLQPMWETAGTTFTLKLFSVWGRTGTSWLERCVSKLTQAFWDMPTCASLGPPNLDDTPWNLEKPSAVISFCCDK